ncbi:MAG: hypothetical protein ACI4WW_02960 [Candidatus Coprovivens sp.]
MIDWIKNNFVAVISLVVSIGSVIFAFFSNQYAKKANEIAKEANDLTKRNLEKYDENCEIVCNKVDVYKNNTKLVFKDNIKPEYDFICVFYVEILNKSLESTNIRFEKATLKKNCDIFNKSNLVVLKSYNEKKFQNIYNNPQKIDGCCNYKYTICCGISESKYHKIFQKDYIRFIFNGINKEFYTSYKIENIELHK